MEMTMDVGLMERMVAALERVEGLEIAASSSLEQRLREAEATIASLRAAGGRKTTVGALAAKQEGLDGAGLDAALASLSIEQRIAVKAQMLRSGLV